VKYEDFLKETTTLVQNLTDQGKVTEILTKISDAYKTLSENHAAASVQQEEMTKQITSLKEQNMNLFLRTGQPVETKKLNDPEPLTFEDLLSKEFGVSE
jgi:uncharacterized glyoxalase superfamily metalloenzyme YdcJ